MTKEEFMENIPQSFVLINNLANELANPKQKKFQERLYPSNKEDNRSKKIKIPKFKLEDIEDYYTYYVLILGISEDLFWNIDISSLEGIVANKVAYDNYISYVKQRELERRGR